MSQPPDPDTCAVTLTHEVQHLKLCAVLDIVSLTLPDDGRRYYAPWRTDPRPVSGLLQGAYAYLGVTEFWRRQRQLATGAARLRADGEFALWRAGTARVIDALLSGDRLTPAGAVFVQGMSTPPTAGPPSPSRRRHGRSPPTPPGATWPSGNWTTGPSRPDLPAIRSAAGRSRPRPRLGDEGLRQRVIGPEGARAPFPWCRRRGLGLLARPGGAQVERQVRGAGQGERVILAKQPVGRASVSAPRARASGV